jgi:hypothetical protein
MATSCSSFMMQLCKYSDVDTCAEMLLPTTRVSCWLAKENVTILRLHKALILCVYASGEIRLSSLRIQ